MEKYAFSGYRPKDTPRNRNITRLVLLGYTLEEVAMAFNLTSPQIRMITLGMCKKVVPEMFTKATYGEFLLTKLRKKKNYIIDALYEEGV